MALTIVLALTVRPVVGTDQPPQSSMLQRQTNLQAVADRHYRMGARFLQQGRVLAAVGHLRYSVAIQPDHVEALRRLGDLYYRFYGAQAGGREAAESFFTKVIELRPRELYSYLYRARIRSGQGEFRAAEADALSGLQIEPDNEALELLLANLLFRQHRFDEAAELYRQIIGDGTDNLEVRWNLLLATEASGEQRPSLPASLQLAYPAADAVDSPVRFTDVAASLGIDKLSRGRAAVWADFDNDGLEDIFCVGIQDLHSLYRNLGDGTFTEVTGSVGLIDPRGGYGALAADFDNDGDQDLYVTRDAWGGPVPNSFYRQEARQFLNVAARVGVAGNQDSFTAATADYDGDGDLDLYVANGLSSERGSPNALYRNRGDGTFEEVATTAGVANPGRSVGTAWGDYNNDGHPDLYVANYGSDNTLYRNRGDGSFETVTGVSGTAGPLYSFITFFFDYDNDRLLDLLVVSWTEELSDAIRSSIEGGVIDEQRRLALLRNKGDGSFEDVTVEASLAINSGAMSAAYADLDNDGYLDVIVGNGGPLMDRYEPDRVFRNLGNGRFAEISRSVGLANIGKTHGIVGHDYDRDGDIDFYVGVGGQESGDRQPNAFFRNSGSGNHWLTIRLVGTTSNLDAVGTKVTVWTEDLARYQELSIGGGFGSTNSKELEFGLGGRTAVDRVEITWPAGGQQTLEGVVADQFIVVIEGQPG